eukprot:jgi/Tetstr1/448474/TSEL_035742.t1
MLAARHSDGDPFPSEEDAECTLIVIYKKQGNARNYLARHYFQDEGKDAQVGKEKGPLSSEDRLAKALDLVKVWQQSELGRYYQAGKSPPRDVMFKGEEEVCELHGLVSVLAQKQKRADNTKKLAVTQAVPRDNVDEGSSPEPRAKKAKQPAKPAAGKSAGGWGGARARGRRGVRAGRQAALAAIAAASTASSMPAAVAVPAETGCK